MSDEITLKKTALKFLNFRYTTMCNLQRQLILPFLPSGLFKLFEDFLRYGCWPLILVACVYWPCDVGLKQYHWELIHILNFLFLNFHRCWPWEVIGGSLQSYLKFTSIFPVNCGIYLFILGTALSGLFLCDVRLCVLVREFGVLKILSFHYLNFC